MNKKKALSLVSAAIVAATLVASALGHGPLAEEIRNAVCGEVSK